MLRRNHHLSSSISSKLPTPASLCAINQQYRHSSVFISSSSFISSNHINNNLIVKYDHQSCLRFSPSSSSSSASSPLSTLFTQKRFQNMKSAVLEEKQAKAAAELPNDVEKIVPTKVATILKNNGLLTLSFPRSAWGYLLRVSDICQKLSGDNYNDVGTDAATAVINSDRLIAIKQKLRRELELLEGTQFGETLRQIRDACTLLEEEAEGGDKSLEEMALEDIERLATKENLGGDSGISEIEEILGQIVDDADELNTIATKWTLETMGRAGGEEAAIFAREMMQMYKTYCSEVRGWAIDDISEPDSQGAKIRIVGNGIYQFLRHEIGTHRVQRVPSTETSGRLQTSTASVFLLPQPSQISVNIDPNDYEIEMVRGGGPGGQGVNSSSNCCRLFHKPTGINLRVHQTRSGNENKALALDMLAQKLWEKKFKESKRSQDDVFSMQWSSGERGERMRTYNFPQNRITDHRYNWNCNQASKFMGGTGPLEELHELAVKVSRERSFKKVLDELAKNLPVFDGKKE